MGGGSSCTLTCGDVGSDLAQLMAYNGLYKLTNMEGHWHQIFALDNSGSDASSSYSEKYTVGYSKTDSTTVVNEWNVGLSAKIEEITISAGYKSSVQKYNQETWSTSLERDLTINVPAHAQIDYEQRTLSSMFQMQSTWIVGTGDNAGHSFYFEPDGANGFKVRDNDNNECGSCHYTSGNIVTPTLGFNTNCYSTSLDPVKRNQWCPEPQKGTEEELTFSSESSLGLLSMIKINVPGEDCNACEICKEQLAVSNQHRIFANVGASSDQNALQACLNMVVCTNSTSPTESCIMQTTQLGVLTPEDDDSNSGHGFLIFALLMMTTLSVGTSACAYYQYRERQKADHNYVLMNDAKF